MQREYSLEPGDQRRDQFLDAHTTDTFERSLSVPLPPLDNARMCYDVNRNIGTFLPAFDQHSATVGQSIMLCGCFYFGCILLPRPVPPGALSYDPRGLEFDIRLANASIEDQPMFYRPWLRLALQTDYSHIAVDIMQFTWWANRTVFLDAHVRHRFSANGYPTFGDTYYYAHVRPTYDMLPETLNNLLKGVLRLVKMLHTYASSHGLPLVPDTDRFEIGGPMGNEDLFGRDAPSFLVLKLTATQVANELGMQVDRNIEYDTNGIRRKDIGFGVLRLYGRIFNKLIEHHARWSRISPDRIVTMLGQIREPL